MTTAMRKTMPPTFGWKRTSAKQADKQHVHSRQSVGERFSTVGERLILRVLGVFPHRTACNSFSLLLVLLLGVLPLSSVAQSPTESASVARLYQEGRMLFLQRAYAAALSPLRAYVQQTDANLLTATSLAKRMEAEYMLVCADYELNAGSRLHASSDASARKATVESLSVVQNLRSYLDTYPDTPHANRLTALLASVHFFNGEYDEAVALYHSARLHLLPDEERNDMTFRMALSYLRVGNLKESAIWLETLRGISTRHAADTDYYLSYIRYTRHRYDEALQGFLPLRNHPVYGTLAPYYIAEIYLRRNDYARAEAMADDYLAAHPQQTYTAQMHRIKGEAAFHAGNHHKAVEAFEQYLHRTDEPSPRRDARYHLGLAYYHTGVYSRAAEQLAQVAVTEGDALSQNAYLHRGLALLRLSDKTQARMAFEQAAASDADRGVKEQAAYNYALCLHETSYSAFGESVSVFERFLNDFPDSRHAGQISSYLVEVYMNTRSYEAALASIERIARPGSTILETKQRILFHLGTQAFANTLFEQAISRFDASVALARYNARIHADALYWRAEAYYRLDRLTEAARDFNAYLALERNHSAETYALAHYNLGYIAFRCKNYASAQNLFLRYTSHTDNARHPEVLADAYNRLGDCALYARRFDEAKAYYARTERMPNVAVGDYACYQLALVAGLQKDYAGKAQLLDRLAARYPASPYLVNALYEKGRSYAQAGDSRRAIAVFEELVKSHPESPLSRKAAVETGLLYYQQDNTERAIAAYRNVVTNYPGSEEARLALRDLKSIYVETDRVNEFAVLASTLPGEIAFDVNEQDSLTYVAAERVYMRGETVAARNSFSRYLQSYPGGAFTLKAHYYLCVIGHTQQDDEAVLAHAGKLLEYPDSPYAQEVLPMRAAIFFNRKLYAESLADYQRLKARASTPERRQLAATGILRCAALMNDDAETIAAATALLGEPKLSPELRSEALYFRAKAYLAQNASAAAVADLKKLAEDTRTLHGAEAQYLLARQLFESGDLNGAEQEVLGFIDRSTPHAYWLARSFVLLADIYTAQGRQQEARQYLLSLQQNYRAEDDIQDMIRQRMQK